MQLISIGLAALADLQRNKIPFNLYKILVNCGPHNLIGHIEPVLTSVHFHISLWRNFSQTYVGLRVNIVERPIFPDGTSAKFRYVGTIMLNLQNRTKITIVHCVI